LAQLQKLLMKTAHHENSKRNLPLHSSRRRLVPFITTSLHHNAFARLVPHRTTMPRRVPRPTVALAVAFVFAAFVCFADAKGSGDGKSAATKKGPARAVKSDVKYIKCQVCETIATALSREASALRDINAGKLTEAMVLEKVEKVCDPKDEVGEWLVKIDLVEKGSELRLKHMGADVFGKCGTECKTMQRACEDIVSDRDTDIAELLFTSPDMKSAGFGDWLCQNTDESALGACLKKAPALKKDRQKGPPFEPVDKKEIDMQRMMKQMEALGMGGMQMYGRDDMAEMASGGGDYGDDADEALGGGGGESSFDDDFQQSDVETSGNSLGNAAAAAVDGVKHAWSGLKRFGGNLLNTAKTGLAGKEEDNVELR
jgi:hypothetical protein